MARKKHTFILTDGNNLFHRQIRMTNPALGIDNMIGMSFHLILNSMRKEFNTWNGTHTVFFLEGRSWRKDIYPDYKANRKIVFAQQTEKEQEDFRILTDSFNEFVKYLDEKTNVTVLRNPKAEADDMIAVWIEAHPEDNHILISSDSDFFQLLRFGNVKIYDPVKDILIQQDGIFNDNGERLAFVVDTNAKIKVGKPDPNFVTKSDWYEYALFLKCIRGDSTDNIFSAYPGVREKGSSSKIGILEAYADRETQGYNWNNFMLQRWIDHEENEHRVKEKYEFNRKLIDLKEIPENVITESLEIISTETNRKNIAALEIGTGFMKFCGKWDLKRIGNSADSYMSMLKSRYCD